MRPSESRLDRNQRVFGVETPVAVVTGSIAPRVGRAIANQLLSQHFSVVMHTQGSGNSVASASEADNQGELCLSGAVECEENVQRWLMQVLERFERVDVVVNSAAIWKPKKLEATTSEDFEDHFRVNALGTALMCKHFGLAMARQPAGGAIVNLGDWATARPYPDFSSYFPSKAAVESITRSMAIELAERNTKVRVNAILPGPVMIDSTVESEKQQQIAQQCVLKRPGSAEDVADAALFLATSPFITGVCLPVDGGRTIYPGSTADAIAHPAAN